VGNMLEAVGVHPGNRRDWRTNRPVSRTTIIQARVRDLVVLHGLSALAALLVFLPTTAVTQVQTNPPPGLAPNFLTNVCFGSVSMVPRRFVPSAGLGEYRGEGFWTDQWQPSASG
jgi:hypothetical protein